MLKVANSVINASRITGVLPVANGGTAVTTSTGTGNTVLSASPTFSGTAVFAALSGTGYSFSGSAPANSLTLDSSGNLLSGTAATFGGPGRINVGFNQSTNFGIVLKNSSATATGVFVSFENSSGGGNGSITQTNSATIAYNTASDRRLKTNVSLASSASSDIDAIQIVSHGWVSNNDIVKYGVIAQDLELVAPQAVTKGDDGEEIKKTWGLDYSKLVPMLIKEVQSLRTRIAKLESK